MTFPTLSAAQLHCQPPPAPAAPRAPSCAGPGCLLEEQEARSLPPSCAGQLCSKDKTVQLNWQRGLRQQLKGSPSCFQNPHKPQIVNLWACMSACNASQPFIPGMWKL